MSNPDIHIHNVHSLNATDIEQRLIDADKYCKDLGLRFTSLRQNVYRLILQANTPLGAYDLIQSLQVERAQKSGEKAKIVAPPTIYRTLEFLLECGFIHQLNSINAFVPCCHPRNDHNAVFLMCNVCQRVQECSDLPVQEVTKFVRNNLGFQITKSVMEFHGLCQTCLQDTTSSALTATVDAI